ncbi:hypothetical protein [Aeromonas veronii]|uniref:Leucine-rich repeat domain-containing protein n=1 Tax=Aeromonas veronii TaxID=654 RepID=A0A2T4MUJ2_AERVE|nr:hypothetical protein [Aeromonas veronii]PTH78235.1 hypothetical protein DAA48_25880 [Aeromonas veronii]
MKFRIKKIAAISCLVMMGHAYAESSNYIIRHPVELGLFGSNETEKPEDPSEPTKPEENGSGEWIQFFHSKNTLLNTKTMQEWSDGTTSDVATLTGLGLTNSVLPKSTFGIDNVNTLLMESNGLSNVDFLGGVSAIGELRVSNNPALTDISGMSAVELAGNLYLNKIGITNVNALSNLKSANYIDVSGNKISDYSGLRNLSIKRPGNMITVIIDYQDYYSKKRINWNEPFCQAFEKGDLYVRFNLGGNSYSNAQVGQFCYGDNEWINFLHERSRFLGIQNIAKLANAPYNSIDIGSMGLTNSMIPASAYPNTMFGSLNIESNSFENLNFLSNITFAGNLNAQNNTKLKDISGLRNVTYINNLNMRNVPLTSLNGLENVTRTGGMDFRDNPNLRDISALSNLTSTVGMSGVKGHIIFTHVYFNSAPALSSPFCESWMRGDIRVYQGSSSLSNVNYSSVCK